MTEYFISRSSRELSRSITTVPEEIFEELSRYDWPGNVREMENVIKRAVVVTTGDILLPESISFGPGAEPEPPAAKPVEKIPLAQLIEPAFVHLVAEHEQDRARQVMPALEKVMVAKALEYCGGNQVRAAKLLGMSRQTLRNRIAKWGLSTENGRD